jgi:hypothetical protein
MYIYTKFDFTKVGLINSICIKILVVSQLAGKSASKVNSTNRVRNQRESWQVGLVCSELCNQ